VRKERIKEIGRIEKGMIKDMKELRKERYRRRMK